MQYHLNGFRSGDPHVAEPHEDRNRNPDHVDVLIVGCGPAGLTLAAQLAAFPDITTRIVDQKPGPLEMGQADGIACRTMEMFEAFGFADKVAKEAYWVNEVTFWRPGPDGVTIERADRIQDVEEGISEMPHTILSQARIHDFLLETMRHAPSRLVPDYNLRLVQLKREQGADYPVAATFDARDGTESPEIRARYVVGCDSARSAVRASMGLELKGQSARQLWGVMDVLAVSDFPDMRLKCAIQSADAGSLLIIPREGGYMVRMYIELDELQGDERASDRDVSAQMLIAKAEAILGDHSLQVKQVVWWSAYEIGQRVCDVFDDADVLDTDPEPRIFIAGDACHTHSPKAGQGMNVSMADTFNIGWKLAAVLRGQAQRHVLRTYSAERRAKAQELIDFDRDMARLFSESPTTDAEAAQFQRYFKRHGRYTAGVATRYDPSLVVGPSTHQDLATGYPVGMRFHSACVTRWADARPVHLGHMLKADGRWRVILFAGSDKTSAIARTCDQLLNDAASPLTALTPVGDDIDAVIDIRAVYQCSHRDISLSDVPPLLLPRKGRLGLLDYEKVFCAPHGPGEDIYELRGIDRQGGAMVVVRPDQFVAHVLPLNGVAPLAAFFNRFMCARTR